LGGVQRVWPEETAIGMTYGILHFRVNRRCVQLPHEQRDQNDDWNGHAKEKQEY
jgi:hypothetical protein